MFLDMYSYELSISDVKVIKDFLFLVFVIHRNGRCEARSSSLMVSGTFIASFFIIAEVLLSRTVKSKAKAKYNSITDHMEAKIYETLKVLCLYSFSHFNLCSYNTFAEDIIQWSLDSARNRDLSQD